MPSPHRTREIARHIAGPTYNGTTITGTKALTNADDGQTWLVSQAAAYTISLPKISTVQKGWNATFSISVTGSNNVVVAPASGDEDTMYGLKLDVTDTVEISDADSITFATGASVLCDRIYVETDGTRWFVFAMSSANNGHVITDS
jgi:hypothetical protein